MRVLVVTSEWPTRDLPASGPWVARQVHALRKAGILVDVSPFRGARQPLNYLRARRRVRAALRSDRYDLVHAHFGHSGVLIVPTTVPLVVTFHGSDLEGIVGRRGRYTVWGWILRRISRFIARAADAVIIVAPALGRHLPRSVRYEVIPMGVDLDVFYPEPASQARARLGLPEGRRLILFSGDPSVARKRYALAQEAVRLLGRHTNAELVTVVGQPPEVVRDHMNACDVLVVTAMHEGSPVMVKEALACDLPVVSVDVGDVRSVIGSVDGCAVVMKDDPTTIARALERCLAGANGFTGRRFAEPMSEDILTRRVLRLYRDAMSHGQETPSRM